MAQWDDTFESRWRSPRREKAAMSGPPNRGEDAAPTGGGMAQWDDTFESRWRSPRREKAAMSGPPNRGEDAACMLSSC